MFTMKMRGKTKKERHIANRRFTVRERDAENPHGEGKENLNLTGNRRPVE